VIAHKGSELHVPRGTPRRGRLRLRRTARGAVLRGRRVPR
jgi:hypothetical protein